MRDLLSGGLILLGTVFMLIASLGVFRMPDFLARMHCSTKAGSLGAGCLLLAVASHFGELGISTRAFTAIIFILLTAPVAAHAIGRAAYFLGTPLWKGTFVDELRASRPSGSASNPKSGH